MKSAVTKRNVTGSIEKRIQIGAVNWQMWRKELKGENV